MALKKKWYDIVAPEPFDSQVVGQTLAVDPKYLKDRVVEVSMIELGEPKKFFIKLRLRIVEVDGDRALTKLIGHTIMRDRVYRMVQRRSRRVDVIEKVTARDGREVRVKAVFVLIRRVTTSIKDSARAKARTIIQEKAKKSTFNELIGSVIKGTLASEIRKKCAKIYPVGNVEIRQTELIEKHEEESEKEKVTA